MKNGLKLWISSASILPIGVIRLVWSLAISASVMPCCSKQPQKNRLKNANTHNATIARLSSAVSFASAWPDALWRLRTSGGSARWPSTLMVRPINMPMPAAAKP